MNTPESLRSFTEELIRRGLPVEYSRRAAEELADHHRDLVEECLAGGMSQSTAHASADKRLGDTKSLVKKTVRAYQHRHWCGRWRIATFVVGPVVLLVTAWISSLWALFFTGKLFKAIGWETPQSSHDLSLVILYAAVGWFLLVIPAGLVFILFRLAIRSGLSWAWIATSSVLIAVSAGLVRTGFVPSPETVEHPFMISMPLGMPFESVTEIAAWYIGSPLQIAQALLPLLTAAILVWQKNIRRQRSQFAASQC